MTRLVFLGTGAAGGTPGEGRTAREESSLLVSDDTGILIDVTRHFSEQADLIDGLDAILLTHPHRDACGGIPSLRAWWRERDLGPIRVYAHPAAIERVRERYAQLDHCRFVEVQQGSSHRLGPWTARAVEVPHASDATRYPTYAWRLDHPAGSLTYASDLAEPIGPLRELAAGSRLLVADGATFGRRIFSHLRIDEDLATLCEWEVERILLTQIGRSAPAHEDLVEAVREICPRAEPAHDGLVVEW